MLTTITEVKVSNTKYSASCTIRIAHLYEKDMGYGVTKHLKQQAEGNKICRKVKLNSFSLDLGAMTQTSHLEV